MKKLVLILALSSGLVNAVSIGLLDSASGSFNGSLGSIDTISSIPSSASSSIPNSLIGSSGSSLTSSGPLSTSTGSLGNSSGSLTGSSGGSFNIITGLIDNFFGSLNLSI